MARERIHNSNNKKLASTLRKNLTEEERRLWYCFLNKLSAPYRFNRQVRISNYIVDFCCSSQKIVIEIDGSQHYDNDEAIEKDKTRDKTLTALGYKVLRYTNLQINREFKSVCADIYVALGLEY